MAANPRAAAVAALVRQEQDGFSNLILDAELKRQKLEGRDKAFASAIFYTVLEHRGTLDYILEQFLPKGLAKLDAPVREILRAALAQARYMQVPVSAAVNEAVKLTRSFKKSSASGLVNAVLRRACTYDLDTAVFRDDIERLMVLGSAGRDVAEFLHKNYPDEARNILTYKADGGLTSLRANPLKADAAALCEKLTALGVREVRQGVVPGSVLARFEGSPADQELFRQGYYHVEGQASQLAALCVEAKPGETVLDLCAAPGGKTLLLAEEMQNTGTLYSCDAAENRVQLIRTAVERMGFTNVKTLCNDATQTKPTAFWRMCPAAVWAFWQKSRTCAIKSWTWPGRLNYWPPRRPFWIQRPGCSRPAGGWSTLPAPSSRKKINCRSAHSCSGTRSSAWQSLPWPSRQA